MMKNSGKTHILANATYASNIVILNMFCITGEIDVDVLTQRMLRVWMVMEWNGSEVSVQAGFHRVARMQVQHMIYACMGERMSSEWWAN